MIEMRISKEVILIPLIVGFIVFGGHRFEETVDTDAEVELTQSVDLGTVKGFV